jgi:hypothetical protein
MTEEAWRGLLVGALAVNAAIGFGYRVYRLTKGGPIADVWGQAALGALLAGLAVAIAYGVSWSRWVAVAYGLLFGLVVMPVWVLGVLLPLRPRVIDYAFTSLYWTLLFAIAVAGIAT